MGIGDIATGAGSGDWAKNGWAGGVVGVDLNKVLSLVAVEVGFGRHDDIKVYVLIVYVPTTQGDYGALYTQ